MKKVEKKCLVKLLTRVRGKGQKDDQSTVKRGFFRNYLNLEQKAMVCMGASSRAVKRINKVNKDLYKDQAKLIGVQEMVYKSKQNTEKLELTFIETSKKPIMQLVNNASIKIYKSANTLGVLYSSVKKNEILNEVCKKTSAEYHPIIHKMNLYLPNSIKKVGNYNIELSIEDIVLHINLIIDNLADNQEANNV